MPKYDYIIGMDSYNSRNMKRMLPNDTENKIHLYLIGPTIREILRIHGTQVILNKTYNDVLEGCTALLKEIKKEL